jgi:hypothetical protein
MTQQEIDQILILRLKNEGWTIEPFKGSKPTFKGKFKPFLCGVIEISQHAFYKVVANFKSPRDLNMFLFLDSIHFTDAWAWDEREGGRK